MRTGNTYPYITAQNIEKAEQSLGRKSVQASLDDGGDLGLADAENLPGFVLGQAPSLNDPLDMDCQNGFRQVSARVVNPKIGKDVAAAFRDAVFGASAMFLVL
jgi:hypothetical protein